MRIPCLSMLFAVSMAPCLAAPIAVTNFQDGEILSYPVPILRGVASEKAETVSVVNRSSLRKTRRLEGPTLQGRFVVLAHLLPGDNFLTLSDGVTETSITLRFQEQTNPFIVRPVYMTDRSGDTDYQTIYRDDPQNYADKFGVVMLLLQSATAEMMAQRGYGRRSFHLALDGRGMPVIHTHIGEEDATAYYRLADLEWYGKTRQSVERVYPTQSAHNIVIAAFTRYDPEKKKAFGHTALGAPGLALFGSGAMHAWPNSLADTQRAYMNDATVDGDRVLDDSALRQTYWAMVATTTGAVLHELGHAFGLPHTIDPAGIMSRGFDRMNRLFTLEEPPYAGRDHVEIITPEALPTWSEPNAAWLRYSRYLALEDRAYHPDGGMSIELDEQGDLLVAQSICGIRVVAFDKPGGDVVDYDHFDGPTSAPTRLVYSRAALRERIGGPIQRLRAIDDQGNFAFFDLPTATP